MSEEQELPVYKSGDPELYYLRSFTSAPDTEITKEQYDAIVSFGDTSQASEGSGEIVDIVKLHREADPASDEYKGEPVDYSKPSPRVLTAAESQAGVEAEPEANIPAEGTAEAADTGNVAADQVEADLEKEDEPTQDAIDKPADTINTEPVNGSGQPAESGTGSPVEQPSQSAEPEAKSE